MMNKDDKTIWCLFFLQIYGWQFHPGARTRMLLREAAEIADDMMVEVKKRFKE
jgi:hypothetical protein